MNSLPALSPTSTSEAPARLRAISNPRGYSYLVSRPPESLAGATRRWPLILFLHGAAERGARVEDVARQGLPRLLAATTPLSPAEAAAGQDVAAHFVVVAPQCAHYEVWNEQNLLRLVDDAIAQCDADPTRVYLTGMSMGAFGAWTLGLRHPARFAALVPICGGGRIADVSAALRTEPAALHSLPIWAFHGARDRVVPLEESERMIDALRREGLPEVKLTIYPEAEHDAWTHTYANPELYRWLLQHRR